MNNVAIDMAQPSASKPTLELEGLRHRSRGIASLTVETPTSSRPPKREVPPPPPARWKTPEFILYLFAFIVVVPILVKIPISLSQVSHPNYHLYQHKLSPGWIGGRQVDNSDAQYRNFRNNIPALIALATPHLLLGKFCVRYVENADGPSSKYFTTRIPYTLGFGLAMIFGLHGTSAFKILAIFAANYLIAKSLGGSRAAPAATWIFNTAILFLNEIYDGYRFAAVHPSLAYLDSIQGFYPRWNVTFNITILRLLSFSMDHYWACNENQVTKPLPATERERASTHLTLDQYSVPNYLAYCLYPPLYIGGPIMTFNNFLWQAHQPLRIPTRTVITYFIRFLACLLTMELVLHYMYVVAIKDTKAWSGYSPAEISLVGFWNLIVVWLKLLLPWRFFRLWALADGIDPPENMVRCMANNYSVLGFWRSWHRSYNLWLVRYVYIPVGGSKQPILSLLLVFTFVALWHDLSFHLLAWGWLVSIFVIPEVLARNLVPESKYANAPWYRHACAAGGVFNILMLMAANLVGFVVGVDGIKVLAGEVLGTWSGIQFLLVACVCLFIGVQVMFEYREEEKRHGIYRRY